MSYNEKGDYNKALDYLQNALYIKFKVFKNNPNHPDIAASYNNLGLAYNEKGDYNKALDCFQKAFKIKLVAYANNLNHPAIAIAYNNLANVYNKTGEYNQAIKQHQVALDIKLIAYISNPTHPFIANAYNNFAISYIKKGEYDKAINYLQEALKIYLVVYASDLNQTSIAGIYNNFALIHTRKKEHDEAIQYYNKALYIDLEVYSSNPDHPVIASTYNNLALVYIKKKEYDKGIEYHQKALEIRLLAHFNSLCHRDIAESYHNLGAAYGKKGEHDKVIEYMQKALKIKLEIFKEIPNHPDIAFSYNNLALAYLNKGNYEQTYFYAKKYMAMTGEKEAYNMSLILLGNEALLKNEETEARKFYKEADPILEQISFKSKKFTDLQFTMVSKAYNNNLLLAAINYQKALANVDSELKYGNHYHNLACFYAVQGNIKKANTAFLKALDHSDVNPELHVEYAQFLILNANSLDVSSQETSKHLYATIHYSGDTIHSLQYSKIEQAAICHILGDIIKQKKTVITVNSKVLAYYLLIKNPEYIASDDSIDRLLYSFSEYSDSLSDDISARLLEDCVLSDSCSARLETSKFKEPTVSVDESKKSGNTVSNSGNTVSNIVETVESKNSLENDIVLHLAGSIENDNLDILL